MSDPERTGRRNPAATRAHITETAFVIFLENGYKSTTYGELVKASAVSKGAFYHHFGNKEELFHEVIDRYSGAVFDRVDWARLETMNRERLHRAIRLHYSGFVRNIGELTDKGLPRYFLLFFEAVELYPAFREKALSFYLRMRATIDAAVAREPHGDTPAAGAPAGIDVISRFEGYLFWLALFPEDSLDGLVRE